MIIFFVLQFKVPLSEVEKLQQAQSEEAQCAILERIGQNLPVTNRTIRGGKVYLLMHCNLSIIN